MFYLVAFAVLVFVAPVVLFRALILLPSVVRSSGWSGAFARFRFSIVFFVCLVVFEAGNFTGFSWERLRYVSHDELIDAAIRAAYSPDFANLEDLQAEYPDFTPEIRYWDAWNWEFRNSLFEKLLGFTRYQVRLPQPVAIIDTAGKAITVRGCDMVRCPPIVMPLHPAFGVIGTVQMAQPPMEIVTDYDARWSSGASDGVLQAGHCFSAYQEGADPDALIVSRNGSYPLEIPKRFGYFIVGLQLQPQATPAPGIRGGYGQYRISKSDFVKWQSCSQEVRGEWPNLGYWWKR